MRCNVGGWDRTVRILLGLALVVVGFALLRNATGYVVGAVGLIPLLTGLTGRCPLYLPLGLSTCRRRG